MLSKKPNQPRLPLHMGGKILKIPIVSLVQKSVKLAATSSSHARVASVKWRPLPVLQWSDQNTPLTQMTQLVFRVL